MRPTVAAGPEEDLRRRLCQAGLLASEQEASAGNCRGLMAARPGERGGRGLAGHVDSWCAEVWVGQQRQQPPALPRPALPPATTCRKRLPGASHCDFASRASAVSGLSSYHCRTGRGGHSAWALLPLLARSVWALDSLASTFVTSGGALESLFSLNNLRASFMPLQMRTVGFPSPRSLPLPSSISQSVSCVIFIMSSR